MRIFNCVIILIFTLLACKKDDLPDEVLAEPLLKTVTYSNQDWFYSFEYDENGFLSKRLWGDLNKAHSETLYATNDSGSVTGFEFLAYDAEGNLREHYSREFTINSSGHYTAYVLKGDPQLDGTLNSKTEGSYNWSLDFLSLNTADDTYQFDSSHRVTKFSSILYLAQGGQIFREHTYQYGADDYSIHHLAPENFHTSINPLTIHETQRLLVYIQDYNENGDYQSEVTSQISSEFTVMNGLLTELERTTISTGFTIENNEEVTVADTSIVLISFDYY